MVYDRSVAADLARGLTLIAKDIHLTAQAARAKPEAVGARAFGLETDLPGAQDTAHSGAFAAEIIRRA